MRQLVRQKKNAFSQRREGVVVVSLSVICIPLKFGKLSAHKRLAAMRAAQMRPLAKWHCMVRTL